MTKNDLSGNGILSVKYRLLQKQERQLVANELRPHLKEFTSNIDCADIDALKKHSPKKPVKNLNTHKAKGLKVAHLNVRSLYDKLDEINYLLKTMNFDILCLSETWLNNSIASEIVKNKWVLPLSAR